MLPLLLILAILVAVAASSASSSTFTITLHLPMRSLETLDSTFWAVSDPTNDNYLQFPSLSTLAAAHGASTSHIDSAVSYLLERGAISAPRVSNLKDHVVGTFDDASHTLSLSDETGHPTDLPDFVEFSVRGDSARASDGVAQPPPRRPAYGDDASSRYTVSDIKEAYGVPANLTATNPLTTVMTWGPRTFGYSTSELRRFKITQAPLINMDKVVFDTSNHGESGGDNFGEGQLDTNMLSAFALNATVVVSNTNTSSSTEETTGFGAALLDFVTDLAARDSVPHVLSMSLGSLSAASCDMLCAEAAKAGYGRPECEDYLATQRQVCMFLSQAQVDKINTALQVLGARGVTVLGASGDGGSHFSFGAFPSDGGIGDVLNDASCANQVPVFPTASPYVLSVGGEMWRNGDSKFPETWAGYGGGSGGGFSIQFPMPSHQADTVSAYLAKGGMPPSSSFNAKNRAYPDMAAVGVSGTSQSCPISAGLLALVVDRRLNLGLPPLGYVAPRLYAVATAHPGEAFEDIVGGDSSTSCDNGFPATEGWDANTGFGRPVWEGWVKYFGED